MLLRGSASASTRAALSGPQAARPSDRALRPCGQVRTRKEPLTGRERTELHGYVTWTAVAGRALLFAAALVGVGAVCRRVQQWLQLSGPFWLLPTIAAGLFLYVRSRRWTGGHELRRHIRLDLEANAAVVHHVQVQDAILFEEAEDEGPLVFLLTDTNETLVFTGQELSRDVVRGFPWREFEIRESAHSRRFLGLKRLGEPLRPSAVKAPLSPDQLKQLGLSSVGRWQRLEVPFDNLRQVT